MNLMNRIWTCNGPSDCLTTLLGFLVVIVAWLALLCWMFCDKVS
jgi:hypothetical protein